MLVIIWMVEKPIFFFFELLRKEFSHPFKVSVLLQSRLNFPRHDCEDKNVSHVLCQQILSLFKIVTPCKECGRRNKDAV